jgi:transcriptional regulator with XRE-family HTH domain
MAGNQDHNMVEAGQKLKRVRERLNLRYRDVEEASIQIAERRQNDEFAIALSRLSDIENKGTTPTIYRLYSLCAIYRLDLLEVLEWYRVDLSKLPSDGALTPVERTHRIGSSTNGRGDVQVPLLDAGVDLRKTSYLSRMVKRWGTLPLSLLNGIDVRSYRYAFIGSDDWFMYPLVRPGALVLIDETRRKILNSGWKTEFERPIYFFEHRAGFVFGWCTLNGNQLIMQPHPVSGCRPEIYNFPNDIDVIGQISGVAMALLPEQLRRTRA